uniref:uncharacterized protein LOC109963953 isoform X2 n=1 Tax=Monopterus albus TaxID=43700 RepID=UPI0009B41E30|nr:uncharacterized protein LOC109963953 isoform X2 [Monopterus albus]
MENIETPYDDEAEFIECKVCDKSIRGETLYKIHLTTPGHIKCLDFTGHAVRQHTVPEFKDILQYLDYLKIDEPVIGLNYLDELPCNDTQAGLRYLCRLCRHTAVLPEMVHHVIGRKHRQKYVQLKRPDLVTWDKQAILTQGGKIIRARAEIIERQDGRGYPKPLSKRGVEGKLNISRVSPGRKQHRDRNIPQTVTQGVVPSLLPEFQDYQDEYPHRVKHPPGCPNTPPSQPYVNRDRQIYQRDDTLRQGNMEGDLQRADYRVSVMYRQEYMDHTYRRDYEEECESLQRKAVLENESPKKFYSEEVRRGRDHYAEYQPSQLMYPEDEHQWPLARESGTMSKVGRQGSREPEVNRKSFPTPVESDRLHNHLFSTVRDDRYIVKEPYQPASQRRVELSRAMSDIPEPFRRFLKGAANIEEHGKRKRKTRFSDASAEEVKMTKEMFSDEYGPPNAKFADHPRPVGVPLRPEMHGTQHPDLYTESQSSHHSENYQRRGSVSEGVFDMLKNVEIENAEEADFLKNRICSLLSELKSRKSEKTGQNCQDRAVLNSDYNSLKPVPQLSPQHQYERYPREDLNPRQPEDHRGRGWAQHEHEGMLQGYHHPGHMEPRCQDEEFFGRPEMSWTPQATYPERFQEPTYPHEYHPATEEYYDSHSSPPPLHMERDSRIHRDTRYCNNLNKITSTLLELVTKK